MNIPLPVIVVVKVCPNAPALGFILVNWANDESAVNKITVKESSSFFMTIVVVG